MRQLRDLLRRLGSDRRGVSALEAAIALPVLILALCGIFEFGINVYNRQQLQAAVQAGIQYALRNPNDTAGVGSTIIAALPPGAGATIPAGSIKYECRCNNDALITCGGTCPSGTPRRIIYMKVERPPVKIFSDIIGIELSTLSAEGSVNVALQ